MPENFKYDPDALVEGGHAEVPDAFNVRPTEDPAGLAIGSDADFKASILGAEGPKLVRHGLEERQPTDPEVRDYAKWLKDGGQAELDALPDNTNGPTAELLLTAQGLADPDLDHDPDFVKHEADQSYAYLELASSDRGRRLLEQAGMQVEEAVVEAHRGIVAEYEKYVADEENINGDLARMDAATTLLEAIAIEQNVHPSKTEEWADWILARTAEETGKEIGSLHPVALAIEVRTTLEHMRQMAAINHDLEPGADPIGAPTKADLAEQLLGGADVHRGLVENGRPIAEPLLYNVKPPDREAIRASIANRPMSRAAAIRGQLIDRSPAQVDWDNLQTIAGKMADAAAKARAAR